MSSTGVTFKVSIVHSSLGEKETLRRHFQIENISFTLKATRYFIRLLEQEHWQSMYVCMYVNLYLNTGNHQLSLS